MKAVRFNVVLTGVALACKDNMWPIHINLFCSKKVGVPFKKQSTKKTLPKAPNKNLNPTPKGVQLQTVDNAQHSSR